MRSFPRVAARAGQRGFSLLEVMFASTILSIFILGIGGFWYQASTRVFDLVLRQKAVFALSGELERISALYVYTAYAADSVNGPLITTGYTDGLASLPATRLIYGSNITSYASNGYVRALYGSFAADEFEVFLKTNILPALSREYIWIDKSKGIVGRLSWTTTDINIASCVQAGDCSCQRFDNLALSGGRCQVLEVYLEYPYRVDSGTITAPASLQTITLRTIVGRG